ncbi:ABC transporter permease [Streptomyces sp. NPDC060194]|uniref:ABC transporter permease n=1 Tax=Streptomyces sp. NPDC060194 TaxID=3347069 RepID=UPI003656CD05
MRDLLRGELRKAATGRTWWILLLAGTFLCLLSTFGFASQAHEAAGAEGPAASAADDIARSWMMMFLFSSLFGAVLVTREYGAGTISRSVLLAGSRTRLLAAKTAVATVAGTFFGLAAAAMGGAAVALAPRVYGDAPGFTGETALILAGVFVCCLTAAAWGALVGFAVRNQAATVAVLITLTLVVDPGVQALVPEAAQYLLTIAMSSLYRDVKPDLLSLPWAYAAVAAWLTAAWFAARRLLTARDLA